MSSSNGRKPNHLPINPGGHVDPELFLDCVHCGLCTSSCPTYTELGDENDSPRGRIYLMRLVAEGQMGVNECDLSHVRRIIRVRVHRSCPGFAARTVNHAPEVVVPAFLVLEFAPL